MSVFQNHVGISITSSKLNLVEIIYSDKNYTVTNIDEEFFDEFLDFSFKETKFIHVLQQSFDNLLLRNLLNSPFISFALPASEFCFFEMPVESALHKEDLENHIKWEFSVLFPTLKYDEFVFRNFNIEKSLQVNSIAVVCLRRKIINTLNLFALRNKMQLKFVDNAHIASSIAAGYGTNTEDLNLFSVFLEDNCFSILVTKNQNPVYFAKKSFLKITEFASLFDELVDKLNSKFGDNYPIQKTILFGNKNNSEIKNLIESKTNSMLLEINPFEFLNVNEKLKNIDLLKSNPQRFASAVGMSARLI